MFCEAYTLAALRGDATGIRLHPRQRGERGLASAAPKETVTRQDIAMDSSAFDSGTATAVRTDGASRQHALPAFPPRVADPVAGFRPAPSPEAQAAPPRVRRRPRQGRWEAVGSSGRDVTLAREYAYLRLKTLVLSGRFAPGQRLAEERLARELGISRTPIREALHKLQLEGLIAALSGRGFAAARDSQSEMEELTDLRAVLEGYALRVICDRITERQLRRLDEIVQRTEDAVKSQRLGDVARWNARFHGALHALIGHKRRIHRQVVTMRQYAFRYSEGAPPSADDGRWTAESHRRILTALQFRDPDLCERAMREHIRTSPRDCPRRERGRLQPRIAEDRLEESTDTLERW